MSKFNCVLLIGTFVVAIAFTALVTRGITLSQIGKPSASGDFNDEEKSSHKKPIGPKEQRDEWQGIAPLPNILIAEGEFIRADELEGIDNELSLAIEGAEKRQSQQPSRSENAETNGGQGSRTGRRKESQQNSQDSYQILENLSDEEKNELWWRIAAVARRSGSVAYSYSLTAERARPFATEYSVAIRDIFNFFQTGVKSEWRERQFESRDSPRMRLDLDE